MYRLAKVSASRTIPDRPAFLCGLPHITGLKNHPEIGKIPPYATDSITILLFETASSGKAGRGMRLVALLYAHAEALTLIVNKADLTRHAKYPETR